MGRIVVILVKVDCRVHQSVEEIKCGIFPLVEVGQKIVAQLRLDLCESIRCRVNVALHNRPCTNNARVRKQKVFNRPRDSLGIDVGENVIGSCQILFHASEQTVNFLKARTRLMGLSHLFTNLTAGQRFFYELVILIKKFV